MGSRLEAKSNQVRKFIDDHKFDNEKGEEYEGSSFGGFPEYFRRKKIKLQNLDAKLREESKGNPPIFRGIVAHVNGYTQPSLNDLHRMIVSHGGGFMQYLDGKTMVTHIIASSLTPKKVVDFRRYRIVKPAWVVESIKAGRLLPWHDFSVVDEGAGQKVLQLDNGRVSTQKNTKQRGYRDQTDASWYTSQFAAERADPSAKDEDASGISAQFEGAVESGPHAVPSPSQQGDDQDAAADEEARGTPFIDDSDIPHDAKLFVDELAGIDHNELVESFRDEPDDAELYEDHNIDAGGEPEEYPHDAQVLAGQPEKSANEDLSGHLGKRKRPRTLLNTHVPLDLQDDDGNSLLPSSNEDDEELQRALLSGEKIDLESIPEAKRAKLSAEQHNTLLLSDPRIRKSSTLNPDFLQQYYRESRLHHLSTWKADLKSQIQTMTADLSASQKARQKRKPGSRRYILHVDFDSFFVAVSLKKHPEYVDKPTVVAHGSGSGSEIASCNYPARKFGVSNGMWMKRAITLCDDLKVLPYDFPAYEAASKLFYEAIVATGGIVQSVSIDEALVDISVICHEHGGSDGLAPREGSVWREQQKAEEVAQGLRDLVKEKTGCAVSVGIGGNVLLAKVALRKAKPAGQHQIKPEDVLDFIGELKVQSLPGVAYSIGGRLEEIGVTYVKDIRTLTKERLVSVLGPKTGEKIWNYARGIDKTEVGDQVMRKSVSAEVNWGVRFETQTQAEEFVTNLCGELENRLRKERVKGKHLTMKIMKRAEDAPLDPPKHLGHGKCDTFNKSVVLGVATHNQAIIAKEALSIMRSYRFSPGELRGLGVQMTKLEPVKAALLDGGSGDGSQRRLDFKSGLAKAPDTEIVPKNLHTALDTITASSQQQKQLQFQPAAKFVTAATTGPDHSKNDGTDSVTKPPNFLLSSTQQPQALLNDPAQTLGLPRKPKTSGAAAISSIFRGNASPSRKPLNTFGTQFILPSQVDSKVLAELPEDVRSRLIRESHQNVDDGKGPPKARPPAATLLPSRHDLDPEILAALPSSLRDEILEEYKDVGHIPQKGDQAVLPSSPRKDRVLPASRKPLAKPRGRGGKSFLSRLRGDTTTLTQANFVAAGGRAGSHDHTGTESDGGGSDVAPVELDEEFLSALPEDIRSEVIAEHRRNQLKKRSNLEVPKRRGRGRPPGSRNRPRELKSHRGEGAQYDTDDGAEVEEHEHGVLLPQRSPSPTFTSRKLSSPQELRDAVSAWWSEFQDEAPYEEDIASLYKYLSAEIQKKGDFAKVAGIVKWLKWLIDQGTHEQDGMSQGMLEHWKDALDLIKEKVNDAVRLRGLGPLDLG